MLLSTRARAAVGWQPFGFGGGLTSVDQMSADSLSAPLSRYDALALLHQRHYSELVRLAFALTGDWNLAEELAQEAFVRAWRSWTNLRREQSAPAYLRTTVVNLARTSLRRRLKESREIQEAGVSREPEAAERAGPGTRVERAAGTGQPAAAQARVRGPALLPGPVRGPDRPSAWHLGRNGQEPDRQGPAATAPPSGAGRGHGGSHGPWKEWFS
jgi:hypothetical protein